MLNVEKIKKSVAKAITVKPSTIVLKRLPNISDGMNGFIKGEEIIVATFDGLLDDGSADRSNGSNQSVSDGGNSETISGISIICPTENVEEIDYKILYGDYFTLNQVTYVVVQPNLIYDIYWMCKLEVAV